MTRQLSEVSKILFAFKYMWFVKGPAGKPDDL
jgi:hypothetical protein